jgi:transposase
MARDSVHQCGWWTLSLSDGTGQLDQECAAGSGSITSMGHARQGRRSWPAEAKRRIVQETLQPGASVATVAQRHGINANLVFKWRRTAGISEPAAPTVPVLAPTVVHAQPVRSGATLEPSEFVPIGVFGRAEDEGPAMLVPAPSSRGQVSRERSPAARPTMDERPGVIEVDLPDGARIRVDAFVNEKALKRVLSVLKNLV